jgi:putative membrane protein
MKYCFLFLLALGMMSIGCSNTNKAATPDNNSAQPASNPNASTSANANPDQDFINKAAQGNRAEIELGQLVAGKTKDPSVKQFAQMMVKDHTDALSKLQLVAQSKNLTLPDSMPDDAKDLQSKLSKDQGKQLNKDYMAGMVEDHQKDVQEFQDATETLKDPDIKQWATSTLPTLEKHLSKAKQVDAKVNPGNASNSSSGGNQ